MGLPHALSEQLSLNVSALRGYSETLSLHSLEITQHPCGNDTPDNHHE
jgi:hypothetical protein